MINNLKTFLLVSIAVPLVIIIMISSRLFTRVQLGGDRLILKRLDRLDKINVLIERGLKETPLFASYHPQGKKLSELKKLYKAEIDLIEKVFNTTEVQAHFRKKMA